MLKTARMAMVAVLLVLPAAVAHAQDAETLARMQKIAMAYFESHASGDTASVRAFEEQYRAASALEKRSIDDRINRWQGMYAQIGEIEPGDVMRSTDSTVVYRAEAKKVGMWLECAFKFEMEPPYKLVEVAIRPTSKPGEKKPEISEWENIEGLLTQMAEQTGVPAMAAALVNDGEVVDAAAVGVRSAGGDEAVTLDDYWHIGSITKSVTATMIGRLVELGVLHWDDTVGEALSDIDMRDEYRDVTLDDLLHHRGGIQPYTLVDDEDEARLAKLTGTPTEIRTGFAREVLAREPANARGEMNYSNAGYGLAALMAERASGKPWRELLRTYVFDPAGLEHATFGWPATPERPHQPRGHYDEDGTFRPQGYDDYELGEYIAPAGDVSMTIGDLARYARMHLEGLRGRDGAVTAATFKVLHTDPDPSGKMRYACGWVIVPSKEKGEAHWHNGSAGTFYAHVVMWPERDVAVVVAMNVGFQKGQEITDQIVEALRERAEQ